MVSYRKLQINKLQLILLIQSTMNLVILYTFRKFKNVFVMKQTNNRYMHFLMVFVNLLVKIRLVKLVKGI